MSLDEILVQAEKTASQIEAVKNQLEKLKELKASGKISDEAYLELEKEYREKIRAIELVSNDLIQKLRDEAEKIASVASEVKKKKEVLDAKKLIGVITEEEYDKEMKKFSSKLSVLDKYEKIETLIEKLKEVKTLSTKLLPVTQITPTAPIVKRVGIPLGPKICPNCGTANRPEAKFCRKCGSKLI